MSNYTNSGFFEQTKVVFPSVYPTVIDKMYRRLRDIPWRLSQARDALFPSQYGHLYHTVRPYTMCGYARLRGLYQAIRYVVKCNVRGDVVECGTARGGSAALMGLVLKELGADRTLWVFDTFEGLPPPTDADPDYEVATLYAGSCRGELTEVQNLFKYCDILSQSKFIKGLFQQTVLTSEIENIAVLHIDGDWYESVKVCLDHLYDRVNPRGVIQIDDYGQWSGARKAVNEFLDQRGITVRLRYLDYTGRQFIKPSERVNNL